MNRTLKEMAEEAQAAFDKLSPEAQAAHREAQRQSFVRGQLDSVGGRARLIKPPTTDNQEDACTPPKSNQ